MDPWQPISRRRFLKRSFAFSALSMVGCGTGTNTLPATPDPVTGGDSHFLMVGDWGTSSSPTDQSTVAAAMKAYVAKYNIAANALLMLGDNFYGDLNGGVSSSRWQTQFEQMYPATSFPGPVYAVPGNHDYQNAPSSKLNAELAYAAAGNTRWTMPSRYYRFLDPVPQPLVTFIALDSNMPNEPAQPPPPDSSYYTPTDFDRAIQLSWLNGQLAQPLATPFLIVMGHHPLYSDGPHGDNQTLIRDWDPLFRAYKPHVYLGGHDHDLQHIEISGHPTSFFLSGGGGAETNDVGTSHGPFSQKTHGFSHIQVTPALMTLRHLDTSGNLLHKFTKTPDGTVKILH